MWVDNMINISYYLIILIKINTHLTNIDSHSDPGDLRTLWSTREKSVRIYSVPKKKYTYCQGWIHIGTWVVLEPSGIRKKLLWGYFWAPSYCLGICCGSGWELLGVGSRRLVQRFLLGVVLAQLKFWLSMDEACNGVMARRKRLKPFLFSLILRRICFY